ncbi:hypothetical protein [Thalassovita sp.]|uniref:hypothetical protein n=1 Tax=Thalassovita sp. TaxID=1979401 RepID=UPI0029DE8E87|nr:hypothetical protein [Thalassovita sp.]
MAAQATDITTANPSLRDRIDMVFAAIGRALFTVAEASSHVKELNALNAKTDAELARMGLTREDIPRYVFRNALYI